MRKIVDRIVIETPKQVVWDAMADFGSAAPWAPGMRESSLKGEQKAGVGTQRVMRHVWGFRIEEIVTEWVDGAGFSFDLVKAPYPLRDVNETWVLRSDDEHTLLTITVTYDVHLGPVGDLLDTVFMRFLIAREIRQGILGLKRYVEEKFANSQSDPHGVLAVQETAAD
jgi:ligand-binding SRPBCC domain-containing protein